MVFGLGERMAGLMQGGGRPLTNDGGIFAVINAIIQDGPGMLLNKGVQVIGGITAGVSELGANIADRASVLSLPSFVRGEEVAEVVEKKGRSADFHMGRIAELDPYHNEVVVPAAAQAQGVQQVRSSGVAV